MSAYSFSPTILTPGNNIYPPKWPTPQQRQWCPFWVTPLLVAMAALGSAGFYLPHSFAGPPLLAQASHPPAKPGSDYSANTGKSFWLTARPRPQAAPIPPLAIGDKVVTRPDERRRIALPDGSVVSVNRDTVVQLIGPRCLRLARGEVFVEAANIPQGPAFVVQTTRREITAQGAKFAVRAKAAGIGVVVTQGKVKVGGRQGLLRAGQQLAPGSAESSDAPHVSQALAWVGEVLAATEPPLVPKSPHAGGALVALDPRGEPRHLSLRKYHIDVHIEDGFARTTIDQTYFNHENWRLEGTFHFPLPADASISRLAMYVDGNLMEGGMAEREHARNVFDTIVTRQKDPALLEWVDGSTFKMRVFPLEGRQEKRIILSYIQKLPVRDGRTTYRFPAGHSLEAVRDWSFHARIKNGTKTTWSSDSHELRAKRDGSDLLLDAAARDVKVGRDVVLELTDPIPPVAEVARFSVAEHEGARYLMLRFRPQLPSTPHRPRRDWIFLVETAGSTDPLLARTQIEIVRALLAHAEPEDTLAVLTAGTRARTWAAEPRPVTPENVQGAIAFLENAPLIGGLDLGQSLAATEPFLKAGAQPFLVHVGGGLAGLGERREDVLARRIPGRARYVGVAVGKRWSRLFMKAAAERTCGHFTQINPDEPVAWRGYELAAALNAPRLLGARVTADQGNATFLSYEAAIVQGEGLCAVARLEWGARLPGSVTVHGTLDGMPFRRALQVKDVAPNADYLPRTWAKLEIERLLAEGAEQNKASIIALSKAMYVMTPFTSLLALENEAMYGQFNVDRGRKDHWAMYPCPAQIPVVHEPVAEAGKPPEKPPKLTADKVLRTILVRVPPRILVSPNRPNRPDPENKRDILRGSQVLRRIHAVVEPVSDPPADAWVNRPTIRVAEDGTPVVWPVPESGVPAAPQWQVARQRPEGIGQVGGFAGGGFAGFGGFGGLGFAGGGWGNQGFGWMDRLNDQRGRKEELPGTGDGRLRLGGHANDLGSFSDLVGLTNARLRTNDYLRQRLVQRSALDCPIPPNTPLSDALDLLADLHGITFVIDPVAFMEQGLREVESQPVKLPAMPGVRLDTVLRALLSQLSVPGVVLVRHDYLEITTVQRQMAEARQSVAFPAVQPFPGISEPATEREDFGLAATGWHYSPTFFLPGVGRFCPVGLAASFSPLLDDLRTGQVRLRAVQPTKPKGSPPAGPRLSDGLIPGFSEGYQTFLLYRRPRFSGDPRVFTDFASYAPGLNTTTADILAVLEAEAGTNTPPPGRIDAEAARMVERARTAAWHKVRIPATNGEPAFTLTCDGQARFTWDRLTGEGLREQVVCDGHTLLHLYPELAVGARRAFTRFHAADLMRFIPWAMLPAKELAQGADLVRLDDRSVAIVPQQPQGAAETGKRAAQVRVHLLFAKDGRLAERRLVEMPSGKVLLGETYGVDGLVTVLNSHGRPVLVQQLKVEPAQPPSLNPDTSDLALLPLPWRTSDHVRRFYRVGESTRYRDLPKKTAVALFAAAFAEQDWSTAREVVGECLLDHPKARLGFLALVTGAPASTQDAKKWHRFVKRFLHNHHRNEPLTAYLAEPERAGAFEFIDQLLREKWPPGFFQRLRDFWLLSAALPMVQSREEVGRIGERALGFTRQNSHSQMSWVILAMVNEQLRKNRMLDLPTAGVVSLFENTLDLAPVARYERARALLRSGQFTQARELFTDLYSQMLREGRLPLIDQDFRRALQGDGKGPDQWTAWMHRAAADLIQAKRRPAVVFLAWQCWELGDQPLADRLLEVALDRPVDEAERLQTTLAAVEYLWQTLQYGPAERLIRGLLDRPAFAGYSALWRAASLLAENRGAADRSLGDLEKAAEIDCRAMAEITDLVAVRAVFGRLLTRYQKMGRARAALQLPQDRAMLERVVRTAERWRSLDPDPGYACEMAGWACLLLGHRELAWDYLTTATGDSTEGNFWEVLAGDLLAEGEKELAERAYTEAFAVEPANPQILWARAINLQQMGQTAEARKLLRQVAEGAWPADHAPLQRRAREYLEGR